MAIADVSRRPARAPFPTAWRQSWRNLLFAHWPLPPETLRPLLPAGLELDTFEGQAWIGVVPFWMTLRRHRLPPLPGMRRFPEINVRTYVRHAGRAGVWFFSLDTNCWPAVFGGRRLFNLPYYRARIEMQCDVDAVSYRSVRRAAGNAAADFEAIYGPSGPVTTSAPGTLDHFLTERYSLFSVDRCGRLFRADVDHPPWPLAPAWAEIKTNRMLSQLGLAEPDAAPLLHYAQRVDVRVANLALLAVV